jgi:hypothetical protein
MTANHPPRVRTVNALSRNPALSEHRGDGTQAFFRALSEADDFVHARDERDELRCRVQELEAEVMDISESDRALVVAEQRLDAIRKLAEDEYISEHEALNGILAILDSDDTRGIEELIEASSLGTPAAKAARDSVSDEDAQRIIDRVNEMRSDDTTGAQ